MTKRKRFHDDSPELSEPNEAASCESSEKPEVRNFRVNVFYRLIDAVIVGLTTRFDAAKRIDKKFGFLYKFLSFVNVRRRACVSYYKTDVSEDLTEEILLLKKISCVSLGVREQEPTPDDSS
jgi:hypothetical protein